MHFIQLQLYVPAPRLPNHPHCSSSLSTPTPLATGRGVIMAKGCTGTHVPANGPHGQHADEHGKHSTERTMKMQHRKIEENGKNSRTSSNMTNMQLTERKELFGHKCYRTWKKKPEKDGEREREKSGQQNANK